MEVARWSDGPPPLQLKFPAGMSGRIIGRGGSNIQPIQQESGAYISVRDEGYYTAVTVHGSDEEKEKARQMLEQMLATPRRKPKRNFIPVVDPLVDDTNNLSRCLVPVNDLPIDWDRFNEDVRRWKEERAARLVPIVKDVYEEHPKTAAMTEAEIESWRCEKEPISTKRIFDDESQIDVSIKPITNFEHGFGKYPDIMESVRVQGFQKPTPVQGQAWPVLMSGNDMIGIAPTGTGKTLAYLLPALIHIEAQPIPMNERNGPNVLILVRTRELALQIEKEFLKLKKNNIKAVCVYGGVISDDQITKLITGVQIVIATPGRLNVLIDNKFINMEAVTFLVMDEADGMLAMGLEAQIRKSLLEVRPDRQTVMTSATWPSHVRRLAASYMKNPIQVVAGQLDPAAVHTVTQKIMYIKEEDKFDNLIDFLRNMHESEKVIVFCEDRRVAIQVSTELALMGFNYQSIYGRLEQYDRERAINEMQDGTVSILIATDIVSRGIDFGNVTYVINYDFPKRIEDYIHRIGRTGRAGKSGTAITYITNEDGHKTKNLIMILEKAKQKVPRFLYHLRNNSFKRNRMFKQRHYRQRKSQEGCGQLVGGYDQIVSIINIDIDISLFDVNVGVIGLLSGAEVWEHDDTMELSSAAILAS